MAHAKFPTKEVLASTRSIRMQVFLREPLGYQNQSAIMSDLSLNFCASNILMLRAASFVDVPETTSANITAARSGIATKSSKPRSSVSMETVSIINSPRRWGTPSPERRAAKRCVSSSRSSLATMLSLSVTQEMCMPGEDHAATNSEKRCDILTISSNDFGSQLARRP
jgi:hypothetical protein